MAELSLDGEGQGQDQTSMAVTNKNVTGENNLPVITEDHSEIENQSLATNGLSLEVSCLQTWRGEQCLEYLEFSSVNPGSHSNRDIRKVS